MHVAFIQLKGYSDKAKVKLWNDANRNLRTSVLTEVDLEILKLAAVD